MLLSQMDTPLTRYQRIALDAWPSDEGFAGLDTADERFAAMKSGAASEPILSWLLKNLRSDLETRDNAIEAVAKLADSMQSEWDFMCRTGDSSPDGWERLQRSYLPLQAIINNIDKLGHENPDHVPPVYGPDPDWEPPRP
jgi:hypothetical protein